MQDRKWRGTAGKPSLSCCVLDIIIVYHWRLVLALRLRLRGRSVPEKRYNGQIESCPTVLEGSPNIVADEEELLCFESRSQSCAIFRQKEAAPSAQPTRLIITNSKSAAR